MEATPSKEKKKKKAEAEIEMGMASIAKKKQKVEFETKFGVKNITNTEFLKLVKGPGVKDIEDALKKHLEVANKDFVIKTKIEKVLKEEAKAIHEQGQAESNTFLVINSNLKNKANLRKMLDQLEPNQLKDIKINFEVQCSESEEKRINRVISAIVTKVIDSTSNEPAFECFNEVEKMLQNNQEIKEILDPLELSQLKYLTEYHTQTEVKKKNQKELKAFLFKHFIMNNINADVVQNSLELATQPTGKTEIKKIY